jgi:hypothetical protein
MTVKCEVSRRELTPTATTTLQFSDVVGHPNLPLRLSTTESHSLTQLFDASDSGRVPTLKFSGDASLPLRDLFSWVRETGREYGSLADCIETQSAQIRPTSVDWDNLKSSVRQH